MGLPYHQKRRPELLQEFIDELQKNGGSVTAAALKCGAHRRSFNRWRAQSRGDDISCSEPVPYYVILGGEKVPFHEAFDEAVKDGQELDIMEIRRRAIEGYDKPVTYQGRIAYELKEIADPNDPSREITIKVPVTIREFDSTALSLYAKARLPGFGDKLEHTGLPSAFLILPPPRSNEEKLAALAEQQKPFREGRRPDEVAAEQAAAEAAGESR